MTEPASFTNSTPRHAFPLLFAGQTQKEYFLNESLARLDLLLHAAVVSELAEPPAEPEPGACYLVADGAQTAWAGRTGQIAAWDGTAWIFATATDGMLLRDLSAGSLLLFDQGWQRFTAPAAPDGGSTIDAEARAAIGQLIATLRSFGIFS